MFHKPLTQVLILIILFFVFFVSDLQLLLHSLCERTTLRSTGFFVCLLNGTFWTKSSEGVEVPVRRLLLGDPVSLGGEQWQDCWQPMLGGGASEKS